MIPAPRADNTILAGHGRVEAAKLLGLGQVPCLRVEGMSAAEKRACVIADNKLALNAGWDEACWPTSSRAYSPSRAPFGVAWVSAGKRADQFGAP
jgi:hypothetical protein